MTGWSRFLAIAAAAFVVDQATKALALVLLEPGWPVAVFPGFNLRLGFNPGASFGMLSDTMAGRPLVMALLTGGLTLFLAWMGLKARAPLERAGFALIVGGATGNILDRLRQGVVTDFLDFYWRDWHWPTFNGADMPCQAGCHSAGAPDAATVDPGLDEPDLQRQRSRCGGHGQKGDHAVFRPVGPVGQDILAPVAHHVREPAGEHPGGGQGW